MFFRRDPRRVQPLMDFIVDAFTNLDFNAELSFDVVKVISLFSTIFEELGRKFVPWTDNMVERSWAEIHGEHDDVCVKHQMLRNVLIYNLQVRAFVGEILAFSHNIKECLHFLRGNLEKFDACVDRTVGTKAFYPNSRGLRQRMSDSSYGI